MKKLILYSLLSLFITIISFPQNSITKHHAFSGTVMLGVEAGATIGFTDYANPKPEVLGRAVIEYFFPTTSAGILGLKGFFSGGYVAGKDDNKNPSEFRATIVRIGGGISYTFSIQEAVFPYVFAGASYGWVNPSDRNNVELPYLRRTFEITRENYHAEVGVRFLLSDAINLNVNIGGEFSPADNWDAQPASGGNDMLIQGLVGFSYSIFTTTDADGDGVKDGDDQCPDTPEGVQVDLFGCPLDADGDGVPDYLDKCANTPANVKVDADGCPLDSDKDGVLDYLDKCPNTPAGVKVDAKGCPVDSDGDGVPDYLDNCPNTPKGVEVDAKGCTIEKEVIIIEKPAEVITLVLSGDTNFEFNKATLLPNAYASFKGIISTMKEHPDYKWEVGGHTDAIGSDSYNMRLSKQRAQAVVDYLVSQGVGRSNLTMVGYGERNPIATNDTDEGRSMNRRVEIKLLSK